MRIFFAESIAKSVYVKQLKLVGANNCLFSYLSKKGGAKVNTANEVFDLLDCKNIIIDSGAFSAWTKGEEVDLDKYISFCKELKESREGRENIYIVNLDVIPGSWGKRPTQEQREEAAEQGWKNMEYMFSKGIIPIHVFHQHEDFKWLDKITNEIEYLGISPANDVTHSKQQLS